MPKLTGRAHRKLKRAAIRIIKKMRNLAAKNK